MRFLSILFCLLIGVYANDFSKDLKSQIHAEVKSQNLNDAGDYKINIDFTKQALGKYPSSEALNIYLATALYNTNKLNEARVYFNKTLEINPTNEQAANYIEIIDKQEGSVGNKYALFTCSLITG